MNKLLQRQLREHFGGADKVPENLNELLNVISGSYDNYEKDREIIERSIKLSSKEMIELNADLKKEKEELKKTHEELKTFLEDINEIVFTIDMTANRLIQTSAACEKIYGYSPAEFMSDSDLWRKIVYPEDKHIPEQLFQQLRQGKPVINEYRIIHKDKSIRWIENKVIPTLGADMRIIKINGVTSDITERKQAEDKINITTSELEQALEDINKIMNASLDVICAVDEDGYFKQVSAACETIWGYKADELIGRLMIDFVFPEDREKTQKAAINVIAGNNMINFENRYIRKDGSLVPIEWSARWDENDKIRYGVARDVTEKKRSEEALESQRRRYNDLFLQAPSCIGVVRGPNHVYEMANPLYLQLIGKRDIIGKSVREAVPEVVEQGFIEILDEVYKTGKTFSANEMLVKLEENNGKLSDVYLNFICQAYRNNEGNVDGIFFFAIDVTEQVLSRKKIEESELRYRSLVEQATDAICITDASMKFIDINPYGLKKFGYTLEEALQLSLPDILFTEDLPANPIRLKELQLGKTTRNERRLKRKDGTAVDMAVSTKLMADGRLIMFGHDITERKKAESVLKKNEDQLSIAAQIAKLGYWEYDVLNDLFTFTDQFYAIFKTTAEKVGSYTMSSARYTELFVHPDDREIVGKSVAEAITSKNSHFSFEAEHRMIYANGEVGYISVHFYIVKDGEGRTIKTFGVNQDITDRKKGEETLLRSEANLEIKNKQLEQKNKELEQFAYVASHDMQEPLRTTSSFVELLQKQYKGKLDENADKYLTFISQSSDRMKVLIKDLLDYSRIGRKIELVKVDCNIMLKEVLADLGKAITEANAEIKTDDLPVINGYPTEIKQLFQNLVINAIKFRKQNTTACIHICVQKKSSYWEFAVKDNGIGIDEHHRERIFIIFQRLHTRNEYEGSGIGLAHCKKIVELHGGKIWIESKPGEGTTFYFTIPENNN